MRRTLLLLVVVLAAAVAGALAYGAYAGEQEYQRQIAAGDAAVAADQAFQALEAYSSAISRKPDSMLAHLKRGLVYEARGELTAAARDLARAAELDATSTRAREALGDVAAAMGRPDRAAEHFAAYAALDDRSPRVLYKLGLALYRAGRAAQALDPLRRAIALDAAFPEAHYLAGLCHREGGALDEARTAFETALKLAPGLSAPREALAALYETQGRRRQAIDQLEALVALDPTRPERVAALGLTHARLGNTDAAVIALTRGLERFPDSPVVYAAIGHVWLDVADARADHVALGKAVGALANAATHPEASAETLTEYGRALLMSGDRAGAERALRQAVGRLPVPADAYLHLANIANDEGNLQEARDLLVRYSTLAGESRPLAGVHVEIADLSMKLGEPERALRWFERAMDDAGRTPALLARAADAALRAGDLARARAWLQAGLEIEPTDRALMAMGRRIDAATRAAAAAGGQADPAGRPPGN